MGRASAASGNGDNSIPQSPNFANLNR